MNPTRTTDEGPTKPDDLGMAGTSDAPVADQPLAHVRHGDKHIACHVEWNFRREALRWQNDQAIGPNFHPLATEMHRWLLRKGMFAIITANDRANPCAYTNPYTYNCSALAAILADVMNDSHAIAISTQDQTSVQAEIDRIRSYSESVLYIARMCEALIKQLLYCTLIPQKYYDKAALGALLSTECPECRNSGKSRHKISWLGSLGHRYHLCLEFDQCLHEHLKIVQRRRNIGAAHSDSPLITLRTPSESRAQLMQDSVDLGNEFVHMLKHLGDLETQMERELQESC